jgi:hypothetical protein
MALYTVRLVRVSKPVTVRVWSGRRGDCTDRNATTNIYQSTGALLLEWNSCPAIAVQLYAPRGSDELLRFACLIG